MVSLEYNDGTNIVPKGEFRIGASGISRFFTSTSSWVKENLTDQGKAFIGNQGSVTGTILHGLAEAYLKDDELSDEVIHAYIAKQSTIIDDLDTNYVYEQYPIMWNALKLWLDSNVYKAEAISEEFIYQELLPGIGVGGSIDFYSPETMTLYDFKSYRSKTKPKAIAYAYRSQLLTYSLLLIKKHQKILTMTEEECKVMYMSLKTNML